MLNEQVFIACVLSFLGGALLIHYLGPAGKRARRLHKALTRLQTMHDCYYADSQEALIDLDKLSDRLRVQLCEMRDIVETSKRSIDLLHAENDSLHKEYSRQVMAYDALNAIRGTQGHRITMLKEENDLLYQVTDGNRAMAALIVEYISGCQSIVSKSLAVPHKVDYSLIKIKELADLIVGPANEQGAFEPKK